MSVTGPFYRNQSTRVGSFGSARYQKWYRQKPILTPNPYLHRYGEAYGQNLAGTLFDLPNGFPRSWAGSYIWRNTPWWDDFPSESQTRIRAQAKAYARFEDSVRGETSAVGVNIAERAQAVSMIGNRAFQLLSAWRALRRGHFRTFAHNLGLNVTGLPMKRFHGKQTFKTCSDLWLEFWFGWSPLVSDIHNSVGVITRPYDFENHGSAMELENYSRSVDMSQDNVMQAVGVMNCSVRCRIEAQVVISNPSYFLASQLGLTNPLSVAFELIPFSFLSNWVGNVNTWISSDLHNVGLTFPQSKTTYKSKAMSNVGMFTPRLDGRVDKIYPPSLTKASSFERVPGFAQPGFVLSIPSKPSWQRALTGISLLAQAWK